MEPGSLAGVSAQYDYAVAIARKAKRDYGEKLSFTGHSLGGGLATTASIVTGLKSTTFNPAGVHANTVQRHGHSLSDADGLITVYRLENEALSSLQDSWTPAGYIMPDTVGKVYTIKDPHRHLKLIPVSNIGHSALNHKMDRLIDALEEDS